LREKLLRAIAPRSQGTLARQTGIAQPRISKILTGQGEPYARELYKLSRAVGVSLDYLLDDEVREPPRGLSEGEERVLWLMRTYDISAESVALAVLEELRKRGKLNTRGGSRPSAGLPGKVKRRDK
jgi:transcriptional regulator with XRE-family HTH domain